MQRNPNSNSKSQFLKLKVLKDVHLVCAPFVGDNLYTFKLSYNVKGKHQKYL